MLPFTKEQFLEVFARYNEAVWPLQWIAFALGLAACAVLLRSAPASGRWVAAALAAMWAWTGVAYHWLFFAPVNPAAWLFGAAFVLQSLLFALCAARGTLRLGRRGAWAAVGWALVAYALLVYPMLGLATHGWPQVPLFGITPCPVTLFTVGVLLLATHVPWWLWLLPMAWALVGGSAAFLLGIPQDWPLLFSILALAGLLRAREPVPSAVATKESLE